MKPLKISIIVEKKKVKKSRDFTYEVFHIIKATDALGVEFYPKQSVGTISIKQLEAEIIEHQYQIDYRKQVLEEIANLNKTKSMSTDSQSAVDKYLEYKKEEEK